jgi:TolA-binding protein
MGPKLQCHANGLVASLISCTAMVFFHALTAGAQQASGKQTQDLEQQLQQLKQQYDETTQSLQQRIAALEQLIQNEQQIQEKKRNKQRLAPSPL